MEGFALRLFIGIGIIWITQIILSFLNIKEPANKTIFGIVILMVVIFILFGYTLLTTTR